MLWVVSITCVAEVTFSRDKSKAANVRRNALGVRAFRMAE
jgi:hypothetical protein